MKINPLLLVMNPRRIPECISAIEALRIDKVWMTAMWESELMPVISSIAESPRGHTHLILLSDDTVPTQEALDLVLQNLDGRPFVTGYCNLDQICPFVNLTKRPFHIRTHSVGSDYEWYTKEEAESWADPLIPTHFGGATLTAMPVDMWRRFPFGVLIAPGDPRGFASDWTLCVRLQEANVPMVAPRGALIRHVKEDWRTMTVTDPKKRLLNGTIPKEVRWDPAPRT